MSSEDALSALQQAIQSGSPISYSSSSSAQDITASLPNATHIVFGTTTTFPKTAPTRYRKPGSTTDSDVYSLEALYLAWLYRDAPGAEYMKHARENGLGVGFVSITERKKVVDWLEGRGGDDGRIIPLGSATGGGTPPGTPPRGSFASLATPQKARAAPTAAVSSSPTKRRYVPDAADMEVVKKIKEGEIELQDRTTVLRGTKPNNYSSVRTSIIERLKKMKESSRPGAPAQPTAPLADSKSRKRNYPIIIISSSPTSLITMYNVKRFLQESIFEPPQDAKARAAAEGNPKPEDMIPLYRKKTIIETSGREIETHSRYFVVDSVEALSKFGTDAWDRVVCVMTTGQQWQFRPYKWSEPRVLFHHVKGIYVTWSNDPPNPKIKDWNVTELKIDPHRRHVDKSTVANFWKILDSWIQANKPWLMT
ncbi:RNA polymerase II accessory factor [Coprinopsis cinerea okayama7|uniref:RNA polymerase II accessory factor n=1 Tax=Coprinopsis cinerea (strain Okayama-7 / 130 / ATCC MYA-4618 / FGSC 9003) TaxID=240176 RepID=A8P9W0_COPC7|nr:RNA polymerase II accessory factor [Coprinopsis cinerea okayama7\|eukprot:XP_001839852.1 RNA polymerase II accessory factor [Coprinopsis cinerea okayama7\